MNRVRLAALVLAGAVGGNVGAAALSPGQPATIQERARGAAKVVVATVVETSARYERNEFGDELIVTQAELAVEEAIKGSSEPVTMEIEGGTVDGITMRASDLPAIAKGERAVFFLTRGKGGRMAPHLRGQGILKLDSADRIRGSSLTLQDIRQMAREAGKEVK
jgi:hypothetical protein